MATSCKSHKVWCVVKANLWKEERWLGAMKRGHFSPLSPFVQVLPSLSRKKPFSHSHLKLPTELTQIWVQALEFLSAHSSTSAHGEGRTSEPRQRRRQQQCNIWCQCRYPGSTASLCCGGARGRSGSRDNRCTPLGRNGPCTAAHRGRQRTRHNLHRNK